MLRAWISLALVVTGSVVAIAQAAVSVRAKHQPFAISDVRVFDGERASGNFHVVVDNGIIRSVDTA